MHEECIKQCFLVITSILKNYKLDIDILTAINIQDKNFHNML